MPLHLLELCKNALVWGRCWQPLPLAVAPGLSSLKALFVSHRPPAISSCQLCGISLSRFSHSNYGFWFTGGEPTLFLELLHEVGRRLRWSCVSSCSFLSFFQNQDRSLFLLKLAISPCYWYAAFFVLTAKKVLDCCPVCLQRLMWSLQSEVRGFSQNRVYQRQDVSMLRSPFLPTAKL